MKDIKVIFWDLDVVLMDSNPVRDMGFEHVLRHSDKDN
jgi:phosphoglycolate phosphatase-like HAD superfamily hydrolase